MFGDIPPTNQTAMIDRLEWCLPRFDRSSSAIELELCNVTIEPKIELLKIELLKGLVSLAILRGLDDVDCSVYQFGLAIRQHDTAVDLLYLLL